MYNLSRGGMSVCNVPSLFTAMVIYICTKPRRYLSQWTAFEFVLLPTREHAIANYYGLESISPYTVRQGDLEIEQKTM
jgi:hypothetical protein